MITLLLWSSCVGDEIHLEKQNKKNTSLGRISGTASARKHPAYVIAPILTSCWFMLFYFSFTPLFCGGREGTADDLRR